MIPLDLSSATSTPKRPDDDSRRAVDSPSPQEVPQLSERGENAGAECRCCTPDVERTIPTRTALHRDDSLLRPRDGRVRRINLTTRRRRCRLSRHCADSCGPADKSTQIERQVITTSGEQSAPVDLSETIRLPSDPRMWSREDVHSWVRQTSLDNNIAAVADVIADRFPMNGKALCLMATKPEMFLRRVPSGGLVLFHDFRSRLLNALATENASLMRPTSCPR